MRRTRLISKADVLHGLCPPGTKCVFSQESIPEVPPGGARVKVHYAGACYTEDVRGSVPTSPAATPTTPGGGHPLKGITATNLFAGYEVSGIVDAVGEDVLESSGIKRGDHVIVFPYDGLHEAGYAEMLSVRDVEYLVKLPDSIPLCEASLLPTGGLRAYVAVTRANDLVQYFVNKNDKCSIVLLGSGSLTFWTYRLCKYFFKDLRNITIVIAATEESGIQQAEDEGCVKTVHWCESDYDQNIAAKTVDACGGHVDIIVDFVSSQRSAQRALRCLSQHGVLICGGNAAMDVRISVKQLADNNQSIMGMGAGNIDQLRDLVNLIATEQVKAPTYTVYPMDQATEVIRRLSKAEIDHRAVLKFD